MKSISLVDSEPIEELKKLDPDGQQGLLNSLIDMYLLATPGVLSEIDEAFASSDYETMGNKAHMLKSSSGNLGAMRFSKLCAEIEELVHNNDPELHHRARELTAELHEILPHLLEELRSHKLGS